MTDTYSTPAPLDATSLTAGYFQSPPPAPKKKAWFKRPAVLLPVGALVLGIVIGGAGGAKPEPVTIEKQVPGPERIVTKNVEVKVPVTPAVCIEALDLAADMVGNLAEVGNLASDGILAAYNRNGPALDTLTGKVKALNKKITDGTPAVGAATQACRASAK